MNRYFARLAYEGAHYRHALGLLAEGFRLAPAVFLADRRNYMVLAACLAGYCLKTRAVHGLERLAGLRRTGQSDRSP